MLLMGTFSIKFVCSGEMLDWKLITLKSEPPGGSNHYVTTNFSWIPFYHTLANEVLKRQERQNELLGFLKKVANRGLKTISLVDQGTRGRKIPLAEIDPFTFLASFNRGGDENRLALCAAIQKEWKLDAAVPTDFDGLPTVNPQASWFFPYANTRKEDDVFALWRLARLVFEGTSESLEAEVFKRCLQVQKVGLAKLTMGMFWLNPQEFITLDATMRGYLEIRGIKANWKSITAGNLQEYRTLMQEIQAKLGGNFPQISLDAYQWSSGKMLPTTPIQETAKIALPPFALNTIFYGPPGTGKTYTLMARAVEIIDGMAPENRKECMTRFEELRAKGQIGFVTFHQSFSYEEFIEGLRPVVSEEAEGGAHYAVRDGIFKAIALRALGACLEPTQPDRPLFDEIWSAFCHQIEANPEETYIGLTPGSRFEIEVTASGNLRGRNIKGRKTGTRHLCSRSQAEALWRQFPDVQTVDLDQIRTIVGNNHIHFIAVIFRELKHLEKVTSPPQEREFYPEEAASSLLEGGDDYRCQTEEAKRFVLIVDEINRGNISKIFGELITLLENDKRLNALNEIRVTLPYSSKTFALPKNLYLLGTMNTADKSLALLDVALRRRFQFEEIRPDFNLCSQLTENMREVLRELNRRLMLVLDREHRIGHAFFMQVASPAEFNAAFRLRIVPLLQEFFYNDWEGLRAVLGERAQGKIVRELPILEGVRGRTRYAWWHDLDFEMPDFLAVLSENYALTTTPADHDNNSTL